MTQKHEKLSAFVDGEIQDDNMVKSVLNDTDMAAKWQRYHLIRQGLRKELPQNTSFDISARVAEALAAEPAIVAPKRSWRDLPVVSNVVPLIRSGGQLAIAASVAVAMVIGVQQLNHEEQQIFNPAPSYIPGIQGGLSPVSLEQTQLAPRVNVRNQQQRISAFLTDHRNQVRLKDSQQFIQQQNTVKDSQQEVKEDANPEREYFPE